MLKATASLMVVALRLSLLLRVAPNSLNLQKPTCAPAGNPKGTVPCIPPACRIRDACTPSLASQQSSRWHSRGFLPVGGHDVFHGHPQRLAESRSCRLVRRSTPEGFTDRTVVNLPGRPGGKLRERPPPLRQCLLK